MSRNSRVTTKSSVAPWTRAWSFAIWTTSTACDVSSPPNWIANRSISAVSSSLMSKSAAAARLMT